MFDWVKKWQWSHFLGTAGVVLGIAGSPLVLGIVGPTAAAIIIAASYLYKQLTATPAATQDPNQVAVQVKPEK